MASDSKGSQKDRDLGHRNHFRLLQQEGVSWSGREPNVLFQNRGDGVFEEVGDVVGLAFVVDGNGEAKKPDSRGAATADLDGDGDLELLVTNRNNPTIQIFRNDTPWQGGVLLVDLVGAGANTGAIGAQVIVRAGDRAQLRQAEVGSGFLSQNASTLHFGLGAAREVDAIMVRWPSGLHQVFGAVPADTRVRITEGEEEVATTPLRQRNYNATAGVVTAAGAGTRVPRPDLSFARVGGGDPLRLADLDDGTAVLTIWSRRCAVCVAEMPELVELAREYGEQGVRFIGVNLDPAIDGKRDAEALAAFLEEHRITFEQVWGDLETTRPFTSVEEVRHGSTPVTAVLHEGVIVSCRWGPLDGAAMRQLLVGLQDDDR